MTVINEFLHYCWEQGWSSSIYDGIVIAAFMIQTVFLIVYRKKYGLSLKQSLLTVTLVYPLAYYLMLVLAWVENGFQSWGANNIVRVYVYVPLICMAISRILKEPGMKLSDYVAPSMALQQVIGHSVCPFVGCCHGYECTWGVWNPTKDAIVFPVQWLECLVALAIVLWLLRQAKKENYSGGGKIYAMLLVIFGYTRFFLEFLRDSEKLVLGISSLAFHALFMGIVGTVWIFVLAEKEKENKRKAEISRHKRR